MSPTLRRPHSKLGIASCVVGVAMFFCMTILIGASYFVGSVTDDYQKIGAVWVFTDIVALFLPIPVHFLAFVMGIVGLFLPNRRKLFPIVGTAMNVILGIGSIWPWLYLAWSGLGRVQ